MLSYSGGGFDGVAISPPEVIPELSRVVAPVGDRVAALTVLASRLNADGVVIDDLSLRRPTLDDVFLQLTGHRAEAPSPGDHEGAPDSERQEATA